MMNDVYLLSKPYIQGAAYYRKSKNIYLNLKIIKQRTKNDKMFMDYLCFALSHEFLHWLLHREHGEKECIQMDNLFQKANAQFDGVEYLLANQPGGF